MKWSEIRRKAIRDGLNEIVEDAEKGDRDAQSYLMTRYTDQGRSLAEQEQRDLGQQMQAVWRGGM